MAEYIDDVNNLYLNNFCFSNNQNIVSVDLQKIPWVNNSMDNSFHDCRNLTTVSNINNNVTTMSNAFYYCVNLTNVPTLPSSVVDLSLTFQHCSNLINAPVIPNSVTSMHATFQYCSNLVNAPVIPNTVTNMLGTFHACISLVNAPEIPNSVTTIAQIFASCSNLVNAPAIPNNVTTIYEAFYGCRNLVNAPVIPNSVTIMVSTFQLCQNLTGNISILSNQVTNATNCFANTSLTKNVYIPFKYENGVNTRTYNAFINAGYSTTVRKDGALLFDINNPEPVSEEYEYTILSSGKVDLTKYIGSGGAIITPTTIG